MYTASEDADIDRENPWTSSAFEGKGRIGTHVSRFTIKKRGRESLRTFELDCCGPQACAAGVVGALTSLARIAADLL